MNILFSTKDLLFPIFREDRIFYFLYIPAIDAKSYVAMEHFVQSFVINLEDTSDEEEI